MKEIKLDEWMTAYAEFISKEAFSKMKAMANPQYIPACLEAGKKEFGKNS